MYVFSVKYDEVVGVVLGILSDILVIVGVIDVNGVVGDVGGVDVIGGVGGVGVVDLIGDAGIRDQ